MKAFSQSLVALLLLLVLAPAPAWSQSFELLHVAPFDVLRDFDKAHPKPTKEEVKLRDAIKNACLHVEGHAAGIMRRCPKIKKGTVTDNKKPCEGYCQPGIPYILNKGQILIVHYPDDPEPKPN